MPGGTFWAGMTFDDNFGATGATLTQLDNLGMALFNSPTAGSSADAFFATTSAGSFTASNPAGGISHFGGSPPANFGFGFSVDVVPESTTGTAVALCGLVGLMLFRRRMQA